MTTNEEDSFKVPVAAIKISTATDNIENKKSDNVEKISVLEEAKQQRPYQEPEWSAKPASSIIYKFEVLKSGLIVEEIENLQEKPCWSFGRLPTCDIVMAHPTISRYHAILQYRPKLLTNDESIKNEENENSSRIFGEGWYIFDLGSTHGTFLNKVRLPPKTYIRVKVGHMIKLGGSTRNYILQGPESDTEPESELTITELRELKIKHEEFKRKEKERQEMLKEKEGVSWGMGEDADEETDLTVNPYATTNNEELFLEDPKKTLRGFFDREGLELEYKVDEMSAGTFVCRVELPVDDANGRPLVAEICHKGKKKECVLQCALEACRILDRYGVLRQSYHEPLKRKVPTVDSDEDDDFLDRTGDIERKKLRKAVGSQSTALTYDDLLKEEKEVLEKMTSVDKKISKYQDNLKRSKENTENDDLDTFMTNLTEDSKFDKTEIRKLRVEQQRLKVEHERLQRLLIVAKSVDLPPISGTRNTETNEDKKKSFFPLFGKRNKVKLQLPRTDIKPKTVEKELRSDEEELDEDEDDKNIKAPSQHKVKEDVKSSLTTKGIDLSSSTKHSKKNTNRGEKDEKSNEERIEPIRNIGPAFIPPDIFDSAAQSDEIQQQEEILADSNSENENQSREEIAAMSKKRRSRIRIRTKGRENVDMDDANEIADVEKYSKWIPPQNQSGDGMTSLNEKFGY